MRYADQHMHSDCSFDGHSPMRIMAEAAREHGMSAVCFTDHVDMDDSRTGLLCPDDPEARERMRSQALALKAEPPAGLEVRFGLELGEATHDAARAADIAAMPELDFVLGSFHNLRGMADFYYLRYGSEAECDRLNRMYLAELLALAEQGGFDIMAHVGYTSRYMHRSGFRTEITPAEYGDELTALFRRLIRDGRGIEVNVSGLRQGHTTYPNAETLRLYRSLGGELVTVGGDAHVPADAGVGVKDGYALLRELGFRYAAEFRERKPELFRIE